MAKEKQSISYSGNSIGLSSLLTVLFVGLKLTGYISWSWWWVLSPLWISFLLVIFLILVMLGLAMFFK